jgi:glycine C-acetyltransferase
MMLAAMDQHFLESLRGQVAAIRESGLYKQERVISSPQGAEIAVRPDLEVINFCANNYLGLSDDPRILAAAHAALDRWGYGMSSVRFICGTQDIHKELEDRITRFLGTEDTILYGSCFDANGGLFETLLAEEDAVISDALNHASIIDGVRLCKAKRFRYANNDMADLERQLQEAASTRFKLIATDGVFSMDGIVADLGAICDLAERHGALVMVDDSHAVGFMGEHRDAGEGARRRVRWLHERSQGDRRAAAAAQPAVPVLEHPRAGHRGDLDRRARPHRVGRRPTQAAVREHPALPRGHGGGRLQDRPR